MATNTTLLEDLEDLVGQLQSDKITEKQVVEVLSNIVEYEEEKEILRKKNEVDKNIKLNRELYLQNQKANPDDTI